MHKKTPAWERALTGLPGKEFLRDQGPNPKDAALTKKREGGEGIYWEWKGVLRADGQRRPPGAATSAQSTKGLKGGP